MSIDPRSLLWQRWLKKNKPTDRLLLTLLSDVSKGTKEMGMSPDGYYYFSGGE